MEARPITQDTRRQLKVIGQLGCYEYDTILHWDSEAVDNMDLYESVINQEEFNEYDKNYFWYKRPEINIKDTPYSGRMDRIQSSDVIAIQQVYTDCIKMKLCGEEEDLRRIYKVQKVHEDMSDEDFFKANAIYRNDINRIRDVQAKFNESQELTDIHGLHITQLDDYDNYEYLVENVSERYVYQVYADERKERRLQSEEEYLERKIHKFRSDISGYEIQIIGMSLSPANQSLMNKLGEYGYNEGSRLYEDMIDISKEYKISLKNAWNLWKFMVLGDMQTRYDEVCSL